MEVIGVHCTHGYNRTGFLIIAYLVEKEDWSLEAAVSVFAKVIISLSNVLPIHLFTNYRLVPRAYTRDTI